MKSMSIQGTRTLAASYAIQTQSNFLYSSSIVNEKVFKCFASVCIYVTYRKLIQFGRGRRATENWNRLEAAVRIGCRGKAVAVKNAAEQMGFNDIVDS